jgi:vacuolar-type H+-ATPase subunit I/STV1
MTELPVRRTIDVAQLAVASVWLGAALLFVAVVAPAAFAALPTRTLAGSLVGAVLPVLFYAGILVGALLAIASLAMRRDRVVTPGTVGGLLMAISCAAAQCVVAPRIERTRESIRGPIESLPLSDPRRIAFGRLHGASVAWLGVAVVGATVVAIGSAASLRRA